MAIISQNSKKSLDTLLDFPYSVSEPNSLGKVVYAFGYCLFPSFRMPLGPLLLTLTLLVPIEIICRNFR